MPGSGDARRVRGHWPRGQVPVVPQRGARRHVLRRCGGVAAPEAGLLLRPARRRRARQEIAPLLCSRRLPRDGRDRSILLTGFEIHRLFRCSAFYCRATRVYVLDFIETGLIAAEFITT